MEGNLEARTASRASGRQALFVLTALIRNGRPLAQVIGFSWFVFRVGKGSRVKQKFIIVREQVAVVLHGIAICMQSILQ